MAQAATGAPNYTTATRIRLPYRTSASQQYDPQGGTFIFATWEHVDNDTAGFTYSNYFGCMGCHGVAQTKGYSFSFVLLDGQRGADVDTQTNFVPPPVPR